MDFGEFHAFITGVDTKLWMFVMRLSGVGALDDLAAPHRDAPRGRARRERVGYEN